jgi:hypothetical protein
MSREAHVRICERLGCLSPVDSTDDSNPSESVSVPSGSVPEGKEFS